MVKKKIKNDNFTFGGKCEEKTGIFGKVKQQPSLLVCLYIGNEIAIFYYSSFQLWQENNIASRRPVNSEM